MVNVQSIWQAGLGIRIAFYGNELSLMKTYASDPYMIGSASSFSSPGSDHNSGQVKLNSKNNETTWKWFIIYRKKVVFIFILSCVVFSCCQVFLTRFPFISLHFPCYLLIYPETSLKVCPEMCV